MGTEGNRIQLMVAVMVVAIRTTVEAMDLHKVDICLHKEVMDLHKVTMVLHKRGMAHRKIATALLIEELTEDLKALLTGTLTTIIIPNLGDIMTVNERREPLKWFNL